jgi:hypothetical protein
MNEDVRIVLQLLLNYTDTEMVNDEFVFLTHIGDHTLLSVAGILDVLREGVQEHIDYRQDMANSHDCIEILSPAQSMVATLREQLTPPNDVMIATEAFKHDR